MCFVSSRARSTTATSEGHSHAYEHDSWYDSISIYDSKRREHDRPRKAEAESAGSQKEVTRAVRLESDGLVELASLGRRCADTPAVHFRRRQVHEGRRGDESARSAPLPPEIESTFGVG